MKQGQVVGVDHMEWDKKLEQFVVTNPAPALLMTVGVQVLSQIQAQFVGRNVGRWGQLKNARSVEEHSLKDTGAMVCVCGMETLQAMGLGADVLTKTKLVVNTLRNLFAQIGMPVELATDGGPSFTAYDFGQYCKQWGN